MVSCGLVWRYECNSDSCIGGGIERWEDPTFRTCFADILSGNWRQHDPYDLVNRINAKTSLYGRPNQVRSDRFALLTLT